MHTAAMRRHILGVDRQGTPIGVCHVRPIPESVMCKGYREILMDAIVSLKGPKANELFTAQDEQLLLKGFKDEFILWTTLQF